MPIPAGFPTDPFQVIPPETRWYPGEDELDADDAGKLIPPLVAEIRRGVHEWRTTGYAGVSPTSQALLRHWFQQTHELELATGVTTEFRYYFAQREAVETAIWLFECERARDPYSLMRFDVSGLVSKGMFPEHWTRYVFKLATGTGKTKVLSMLLTWSYFHKSYEPDSTLSKNFLLIAPNIIVLDRLLDDFDGLRIFHNDPLIPPNGYADRAWRDDFHLELHVQDEIGPISASGNLFVTNVHRVYEGSPEPSFSDEDLTTYFLGQRPVSKTTKALLDLGDVVRAVDDLVVLNDEAHHIHDESLAWFRAIEDIDSRMRQRLSHGLGAQFDVSATPRDQSGAVFVQTVCAYPLVEAIRQGVVKTPVVPDEVSRAKLIERTSDQIAERYADHIKLGYLEWSKRRADLERCGKKPILFVMTTTTAESDDVAAYLEQTYPELHGKVLTIHTKANGELKGRPGDKELERLREASRHIDSDESPYLCVVSVLMLREGWDVQNVIAMVGLRPFTAASGVLPEQTLGRGLRRMFRGDPSLTEYVSVVGTPAFLDFVESVKSEGVELDRVPMGDAIDTPTRQLLVEIDRQDPDKDLEALDISLPKLSGRIQRETKNLADLDVLGMQPGAFPLLTFSDEQQREIVFLDLDTDEPAWTTDLGEIVLPSSQSVLAYLTMELMRRMRLVGGRADLYEKLKQYATDRLFEVPVNLDDPNILRNLSDVGPRRHLFEVFAKAINDLTLVEGAATTVVSEIRLSSARPVVVNNQEFLLAKKTIFNRVVGDSNLELRFAQFLESMPDVQAFAKNARNLHFFMEYITSSGELAYYYPDFIVRSTSGQIFIVETKGLEDVDVAPKWRRLVQWCEDATSLDEAGTRYTPLYVGAADFDDLEASVHSWDRFVSLTKERRPQGTAESQR